MLKKILSLSSFVCFAVLSFGQTTPRPPKVGGDKDAHGCITSAGAKWSVLRNDCVQPFNAGIRLDEITSTESYTSAAYVVFKSEKDESKAELFIKDSKTSILMTKLTRKKEKTWKNKQYTLSFSNGVYRLKNKQTVIYSGKK